MILIVDVLTVTFVVITTGITLYVSIRASIWNQTTIIKELMGLLKSEVNQNKKVIKDLAKRITHVERYLSKRQNIISHSFVKKKNMDDDEES